MLTWSDVAVLVKCVRGRREKELAELRQQLDKQGIRYSLCEGEPGEPPRDNFRRLLRMGIEHARHRILHVEDDAVLAPDFADRAIEFLGSEIANVWTFYSARKEDLAAYDAGKNHRRITPSQYFNSQAVSWPTCFAKPMLDYLPEWESAKKRGVSDCDIFIGDFCRKFRFTIFASIPSIVQHREIASLLGHRPRYGRVSRTFIRHYGVTVDVDPKHAAHLGGHRAVGGT